jgi:tetratricopeptide (TPR) repeat protein
MRAAHDEQYRAIPVAVTTTASAPAGAGRTDVPLVSVIVRSMGRPTLSVALASLDAQSWPALDVVVVAASGPAHPDVATTGSHRVRLVRPAQPLQRAAAANAGLDAAAGEWITFLDDDDEFRPEHLATLVAARAANPDAQVVHSYAHAVLKDGRAERFGQPHATMELFDRNYLHLSTAIFARALVVAGCRFDESLAVHEDWDFFLQLAQRATFQFVPTESFVWHADAGTSGAAGGANHDDARFAYFRDRVYDKWGATRDDHVERTMTMLQIADQQVRSGDQPAAQASCRTVLRISQNNPFALNLMAMSYRASGNLGHARSVQEAAVAVHPHDAGFLHNLALLCAAMGDVGAARDATSRALAADPTFAPAQRLQAQLAAAPRSMP